MRFSARMYFAWHVISFSGKAKLIKTALCQLHYYWVLQDYFSRACRKFWRWLANCARTDHRHWLCNILIDSVLQNGCPRSVSGIFVPPWFEDIIVFVRFNFGKKIPCHGFDDPALAKVCYPLFWDTRHPFHRAKQISRDRSCRIAVAVDVHCLKYTWTEIVGAFRSCGFQKINSLVNRGGCTIWTVVLIWGSSETVNYFMLCKVDEDLWKLVLSKISAYAQTHSTFGSV